MAPSGAVGATTELLPDLKALRLRKIYLETTEDGQRRLRFNSIVANVGTGPFQVMGTRRSTSVARMKSVTQQIVAATGAVARSLRTSAAMYLGRDGHDHWHLRDLETFRLIRTDDGTWSGVAEKHGFCFYDNYVFNPALPNSPPAGVHLGCGGEGDLRVVAGLSVGWADKYSHLLPDQYIDVSDVASGRYRLVYGVDVQDHFVESREDNNRSCVNLVIGQASVSVSSYGCGL
ncbi:MAG: lysyl oxidase family protein [Actinomycetota bacterium]